MLHNTMRLTRNVMLKGMNVTRSGGPVPDDSADAVSHHEDVLNNSSISLKIVSKGLPG